MRLTYTSKRAHRPSIVGAELAPSMTSTNWTAGNGATLSNDAAGNLKVAYNATGNPYAYRAITVTASALYRVRVSSVEDGAARLPIVQIGTGPGGNQLGEYDFRNTTVTLAAGEVDIPIIAPGTTIYLSLYCAIGSAGYALFRDASVRAVSTLTHASIAVLRDALAYSSGEYTAVNSTLGIANIFGIAYGEDDNAISITNTGAVQGQAARTNAFPTISGRRYKASCLYIPHGTTSGNVLVGTTYGNGQLGSVSLSAASNTIVNTSDGVLYEFNNSDDGWTVTNATKVNNATYISLTATSTDPQFKSPAISKSGYENRHVVARVKRTSVSWSNEMSCFYSTASHGYSASHYASAAVVALVQNEDVVLVWDMWQLIAGGTDWKDSTITGLRLDFTDTNGATWDVDFVAIGNLNPLEITFTASQSTAYLTLANSAENNRVAYYALLRVQQLDSDYTLEQPGVAQLARVRPKSIGTINTAESGKKWGVASRSEGGWRVTTDKFAESARADWEEFLNSVDRGEEFTFDANGTTAAPDNPVTVTLREGTGDVDRLRNVAEFQATFEVVEVLD